MRRYVQHLPDRVERVTGLNTEQYRLVHAGTEESLKADAMPSRAAELSLSAFSSVCKCSVLWGPREGLVYGHILSGSRHTRSMEAGLQL